MHACRATVKGLARPHCAWSLRGEGTTRRARGSCAARRIVLGSSGSGISPTSRASCISSVVYGVGLFVVRRYSVSAHSMQRCTLHGVSCGRLHTDLRCGRLHSTQRDRPHPPAHVRRVQVGRCTGVYPPSRSRPLSARLGLPPSLRCGAHPSMPARWSGSRQARSSRFPRRRRRFSCSPTSSSCSTPPIACCSASPPPIRSRVLRERNACRNTATLHVHESNARCNGALLALRMIPASWLSFAWPLPSGGRLRSHAGLSGHGGRLSGEDIGRYACATRGPALAAPEALTRLRDSRRPVLLLSCLF
jgi:hypothetical protein